MHKNYKFFGKYERNALLCNTNQRKEEKIMARPIRETPVLHGKDARRFEEAMQRVECLSAKERETNRERLRAEYAQTCKEWNLTFRN